MGQIQLCSYFSPFPPEINVVNLRTGQDGQVSAQQH